MKNGMGSGVAREKETHTLPDVAVNPGQQGQARGRGKEERKENSDQPQRGPGDGERGTGNVVITLP